MNVIAEIRSQKLRVLYY